MYTFYYDVIRTLRLIKCTHFKSKEHLYLIATKIVKSQKH